MNTTITNEELVLKSAIIFEDLNDDDQAIVCECATDTVAMNQFKLLLDRIQDKALRMAIEESVIDALSDAITTAYNAALFHVFGTEEDDENDDMIEFGGVGYVVDRLASDFEPVPVLA